MKCLKPILPGILLLLSSMTAPAQEKTEKRVAEQLKAMVRVEIDWDIDSGEERYYGHYYVTIKGLLNLAPRFSTHAHGLPPIFIAYDNAGLTADYDLLEKRIDKNPPDDCRSVPESEILKSFEQKDVISVPKIPGAFELAVNYARTYLENMGVMAMVERFGGDTGNEAKDTLQFQIAAPKIKITGHGRESNGCRQEKKEKEIAAIPVSLSVGLDTEGKPKGEKTWRHTLTSGDFDFNVRLQEEPGKDAGIRYSPSQDEDGNVSYHVKWSFEEPKPFVIQRKIGEEWRDVEAEDDLREVALGERVELRGILLSDPGTPLAGTWKIDGNPAPESRNFIQRFKADDFTGDVEHVSDFNVPVLSFTWFRGEKGRVEFTSTTGESRSAEIEFTFKRPQYRIEWKASPDSKFGPIGDGDPDLLKGFPPQNRVLTGPRPARTGLQYQGILFTAAKEAGPDGETQWVQLIKETQRRSGEDEQGNRLDFQTLVNEGLDTVYPCARGNSFFDAPAIPVETISFGVTTLSDEMEFQLFLMFRPYDSEGNPDESNEWIPVKVIRWGWIGIVRRNSLNDPWGEDSSFEPTAEDGREPTQADTDRYPRWTKNVSKT